jgi:hypothetical protein
MFASMSEFHIDLIGSIEHSDKQPTVAIKATHLTLVPLLAWIRGFLGLVLAFL